MQQWIRFNISFTVQVKYQSYTFNQICSPNNHEQLQERVSGYPLQWRSQDFPSKLNMKSLRNTKPFISTFPGCATIPSDETMSKDYMWLEIRLLRTTEATTVSTSIMERKVTLYDIFMPTHFHFPLCNSRKMLCTKGLTTLPRNCIHFFLSIDWPDVVLTTWNI